MLPGASTNNSIYQSNPQHYGYKWGKSEMIHYSDSNGNQLQGALFYPSRYEPGKKYPMIVYIYQSMSGRLRQYKNPSVYSQDGFNHTNYTLDGYFVLLPDIYYEIGNPGKSARDCITAAVDTVLTKGDVDGKRMGLIGHSFGGYETNLVIGLTDIFAAAVSGAGISDTVGWYFTIGQDTMEPEAWRFENQQFRMGKSFYENKKGYIDNSPIMHAGAIRTPLLLWCGKEDTAVDMRQSIAMHLALRRLNKKNALLAYPGQGHAITDKQLQKDLSIKIKEWFSHFLQGGKAPDWGE